MWIINFDLKQFSLFFQIKKKKRFFFKRIYLRNINYNVISFYYNFNKNRFQTYVFGLIDIPRVEFYLCAFWSVSLSFSCGPLKLL